MSHVVLTTAPTEEPVTLEELKTHLRVDLDDDNALLTSLNKAATEYAQNATGRQFVTATRTLYLDAFPSTIYLPYPPFASVTSIKYYDTSLVLQTLGASYYKTDTTSTPGRISEAYGYTWPSTSTESDIYQVVQVAYTCGYGAASAVPEEIKTVIKLLVGHWYENREGITSESLSPVPIAIEALLAMHKVAWNV